VGYCEAKEAAIAAVSNGLKSHNQWALDKLLAHSRRISSNKQTENV